MPFCEQHKQKEVTNSKLFASVVEPKRESIIWSAFQELGTSCLQPQSKEMKIHVILVRSAKKTLLLPLIA